MIGPPGHDNQFVRPTIFFINFDLPVPAAREIDIPDPWFESAGSTRSQQHKRPQRNTTSITCATCQDFGAKESSSSVERVRPPSAFFYFFFRRHGSTDRACFDVSRPCSAVTFERVRERFRRQVPWTMSG